MKTSPIHSRDVHSRSKRAVALIVVLSFLSLITLLILGIFTGSRTEAAAATRFSSNAYLKSFQESAINIVLNQIRTSTQLPNTIWVSQPGGHHGV